MLAWSRHERTGPRPQRPARVPGRLRLVRRTSTGGSRGAPRARRRRAQPEDRSTRRLPNYEDLSQAPAVTQIDADIQTRLKAMQRASLERLAPPAASALAAAAAHAPRRRRALPPPPPPPPAAAAPASDGTRCRAFARRPGPTPSPPSSAATRSPLHNSDSEPAEATEITALGDGVAAERSRRDAASRHVAAARARACPVMSLPPAPSVLSALRQRVRFAGGEVPLWSLLTPMVLLLALGSGVRGGRASVGPTKRASAPRPAPAPAPAPLAPLPSALASAPPTSTPGAPDDRRRRRPCPPRPSIPKRSKRATPKS